MTTTERYLSAAEAAAMLGIQLSTLYAYVSRGLIRSEPGMGKSRAKRYAREDVDALLQRKRLRRNPAQAAESALHFGAPVLTSALTLIENGRFYYRGHDVLDLPVHHAFEAVAGLLWQGDFAAASLFAAPLPPALIQLADALAPQVAELPPLAAFQAALPHAAARDLAAYDLQKTAVMQTGARILHLLTRIAAGQAVTGSIAETLQRAWVGSETAVAHLINAALIYCADHELNVSAFAARTVASALATPYDGVVAGLAALQGVRHGGHTERVAALLHEAAAAGVRATVAGRLRRGESIPGFGHPLYPDGDPRGRALLAQSTTLAGNTPQMALIHELVAEIGATLNSAPTLDLGLVAVSMAAELPPGAPLTLFALGRTAGWIGHALEQYQLPSLIRPRARYVGPQPGEIDS